MTLDELLWRLLVIRQQHAGSLEVVQDHTGDGYDCDYKPCVVADVIVEGNALHFVAGSHFK